MKLNVTSVSNPVWGDAAQTYFIAQVTFAEYGDVVLPFAAVQTDPEAHGRQLWGELHAGLHGPIGPHVPPKATLSTAPGAGPRVIA